MSLVDHDSWEIEYAGCERLQNELLVQLKQREQFQDLIPIYSQLSTRLENGLEQLRKDVMHLNSKIQTASTWETITPEELERRRHIYEEFVAKWKEMVEIFKSTTRADHMALLPGGATSSSRAALLQTNTAAVGIPSEVAALKQRQIEMMQEQNRGLEVLSQTLSRHRELASQLGQEVEDQNDILDNLANTMERVESGVQRETGNIGYVNRRDSTWGYWLIIIALFIAIVLVALL